jgi:hypothetical protein
MTARRGKEVVRTVNKRYNIQILDGDGHCTKVVTETDIRPFDLKVTLVSADGDNWESYG